MGSDGTTLDATEFRGPVFGPDTDRIDDLEGNEREARRYREHAIRSRDEARRQAAAGVGT